MKLSINIPYWHTSEDRYNGLLFVIGKINKFLFELKKHNIDCVFNIFLLNKFLVNFVLGQAINIMSAFFNGISKFSNK